MDSRRGDHEGDAGAGAGDCQDAKSVVMMMLRALPVEAQVEIHRALRLHLRVPDTLPEETRWQQLGALSEMLTEWERHGGRWVTLSAWGADDEGCPVIPQTAYDQWIVEHPETEAPDGLSLSQVYGTWLKACRAAYGLLPDGRWIGGRPWAQSTMHERGKRIYTKEICTRAVRTCALALGRIPSTTDYFEFRRLRLKRLPNRDRKAFGLPTVTTVLKYHRNDWDRVLAAAAITDEELLNARRAWLPARPPAQSPAGDAVADRLAALDEAGLLRAGLSPVQRDRVIKNGVGSMPASQALVLAHVLGGSLDWLIGLDVHPGERCPADARLDGSKIAQMREARDVPATHLRRRLGMSLGEYRRLLNSSLDPTVAQLLGVVEALQLKTATALLTFAP